MKNNSQNASISNTIMRYDNVNYKAMEVNGQLKRFCIEKNIFFDRQYRKLPSKKHQ